MTLSACLVNETWGDPLDLAPAAGSPVRATRRAQSPRPAGEGRALETFELALQGESLADWLQALQERLARARGGLEAVYLAETVLPGAAPYRAQVFDGSYELLGNGLRDRARHTQGIRLTLLTAAAYAAGETTVYLSNTHGTEVRSGLTVFNHTDGEHANSADLAAAWLDGAQPAGVRVTLTNPATWAIDLEDVILAAGPDLIPQGGGVNHVLEGESGTPGAGVGQSVLSSTGAGGGYYNRLTWTATTELLLMSWSIPAAALALFKGRALRPVLRLGTNFPANAWLRWKVSLSGQIVEQTGQAALDSTRLVLSPAVRLPPPGLGAGPYAALSLELWLECASAGTKTLDLDFVQLLPASGLTHLKKVRGIPPGEKLVHDAIRGQTYGLDGSGSRYFSHVACGGPLLIHPRRNNRLFLLYLTSTGPQVNKDLSLVVEYGACQTGV